MSARSPEEIREQVRNHQQPCACAGCASLSWYDHSKELEAELCKKNERIEGLEQQHRQIDKYHNEVRAIRDRLQAECDALRRERDGEVWYWMNDDWKENEVDSLACPVLIEAADIRDLVNRNQELESAMSKLEELMKGEAVSTFPVLQQYWLNEMHRCVLIALGKPAAPKREKPVPCLKCQDQGRDGYLCPHPNK